MEIKKCECGGDIVFEKKIIFIRPKTRNGICSKCGCHYELVNNVLSKKDGESK